jgi:hypothetical protein
MSIGSKTEEDVVTDALASQTRVVDLDCFCHFPTLCAVFGDFTLVCTTSWAFAA